MPQRTKLRRIFRLQPIVMTTPDSKNFERLINGKQTRLLTIKNNNGLEATVSNYGARIVTLVVNGTNVTPAYPSLDAYLSPTVAPYHGATVGRFANRIANGSFALDGRTYNLPVNDAPNHLHGGPGGFHARVWNIVRSKESAVQLSLFSSDGEQGYPGAVSVTVTYTLTNENELVVGYTAETTADTPFNITNHMFFNLNGEGSIAGHTLQLNADAFLPVDERLIPTGERKKVEGTAFDFRHPKRIGADIDADDEQLRRGGGYDHCFVLNKESEGLSVAARATGDKSGVVMEILTEEPGVQLFSGNFEAVKGDPSTFRNTFCLETQHFPDSPNRPEFPNTILRSGEKFTSTTVHRFR